jgi:hypothetical protein
MFYGCNGWNMQYEVLKLCTCKQTDAPILSTANNQLSVYLRQAKASGYSHGPFWRSRSKSSLQAAKCFCRYWRCSFKEQSNHPSKQILLRYILCIKTPHPPLPLSRHLHHIWLESNHHLGYLQAKNKHTHLFPSQLLGRLCLAHQAGSRLPDPDVRCMPKQHYRLWLGWAHPYGATR